MKKIRFSEDAKLYSIFYAGIASGVLFMAGIGYLLHSGFSSRQPESPVIQRENSPSPLELHINPKYQKQPATRNV